MSTPPPEPSPFTHLNELGQASMVDVSRKSPTLRIAVAEGEITFSERVMELLRDRRTPKGDIFTVAKVAGVMAAKRTGDLIPLCHPLPVTHVDIRFVLRPEEQKVLVRAEVHTVAPTGVEMEALTAASIALLTIYDMTKASDKKMTLGNLRLTYKEGGKSGTFTNNPTDFAAEPGY